MSSVVLVFNAAVYLTGKMSFLTNYLYGSSYTIKGSVLDGFEPVRQLFEHNFQVGEESKSQLCVYLGEEKIIGG